MSPIDIVILLAIAVAFVAVVLRVRKKGTCGDCASAGACAGSCSGCAPSRRATCPACEGVDRVAERLGGTIDKS